MEPKSVRHGVKVYQVDAFTQEVFCGNPAGVVPDSHGLSEDVMQKIAREMNVSETAFAVKLDGDPEADFEVRFFTPKSEVDLCGHATLGAFWVLAELGMVKPKGKEGEASDWVTVRQRTKAGVLEVYVAFNSQGKVCTVMMEQNLPSLGFTLDESQVWELEKILGAPHGSVSGFTKARPQAISTGLLDLIVPVCSREALFSMKPNMDLLATYCEEKAIVSVHCFSTDTLEPYSTVHCRDFAPSVGIPEEAATGTASGATGAYLVLNSLVEKEGPSVRVICEQGYIMGRPSKIYVDIGLEEGEIVSVRVGGTAVTVMEGVIRL